MRGNIPSSNGFCLRVLPSWVSFSNPCVSKVERKAISILEFMFLFSTWFDLMRIFEFLLIWFGFVHAGLSNTMMQIGPMLMSVLTFVLMGCLPQYADRMNAKSIFSALVYFNILRFRA